MNLTRVSKRLSYLLRHCTDPQLISLDGGWADVRAVMAQLRRKWPDLRRTDLETIVAEDEKGRYSFDASGGRIRANQGHSIPGVRMGMERPTPPRLLYHGTSTRSLPLILRHGLLPMSRQYVPYLFRPGDCQTGGAAPRKPGGSGHRRTALHCRRSHPDALCQRRLAGQRGAPGVPQCAEKGRLGKMT